MSEPKPMTITSLEVENVLRLKAVRIVPKPGDPVVFIRGENGAGKTSVLEAIAMAFGGKDVQPPRPVRDGEISAHVILTVGDLVIERRWTSDEKSTLSVTAVDGARYPSPQAVLDKLLGQITFDPMTFMRLPPKAQMEAVRNLVGLDLTDIEAKVAAAFEHRTTVNRDGKAMAARLAALPAPSGVAKVDVADLLKKLASLQEQDRAVDRLQEVAARAQTDEDAAKGECRAAMERADQLEKALREAELVVKAADAKLATAKRNRVDAEDAVSNAPIIGPELADVREQLEGAEAVNAKVRADGQRIQVEAELQSLRAKSAELTAGLEELDAERQRRLAAAKFPVAGLAFTDDGVTFKRLPLQQASAAEKLRVSLAMGIAANPKVRVMLIRDGSLLDEKGLALVQEMAAAAGAQVWLEMVSKGPVGVVISDGEVESVDGVAQSSSTPEPAKKGRKLKAVETP